METFINASNEEQNQSETKQELIKLLFKAFKKKQYKKIICFLISGKKTFTHIQQHLGITKKYVGPKLAELENAGIIYKELKDPAVPNHYYYSLTVKGLLFEKAISETLAVVKMHEQIFTEIAAFKNVKKVK